MQIEQEGRNSCICRGDSDIIIPVAPVMPENPTTAHSKKPPLLGVMLFFVIMAVPLITGLRMLWQGGADLTDALDSASWVSTEGRVIKAAGDILEGLPENQARALEKIRIDFVYGYEVDGVRFTNTRVDFGKFQPAGESLLQVLPDGSALQAGTPLTVFYDPDNPQRAVLQPEMGFNTFLLLGFGVFLTIFGLTIGYLLVTGKAFQPPSAG